MIKYYLHKSDKPNKNIILLHNKKLHFDNKKFFLALLVILILQFIKMKKENQDISKGIIMKFGLNQVLIRPVGGPAGYYGIYQQ
jgi:hypothetical protein